MEDRVRITKRNKPSSAPQSGCISPETDLKPTFWRAEILRNQEATLSPTSSSLLESDRPMHR
ncbi:hypothetical protein AC578_1682 [Pseudocercospora eumusae]|uniref:Uncharacterized protein n=1 Tax=Pseudocercospora eumusae TaxID=321146 RepID=A0A139GX06_9PEZI|nr:hypothetical protein AC578_1682 [Pseudocercospora eumusae]